ncbi:MAG TPA: sigma-70 family RNA polymerase sigma factor [Fimbriimonadaceae bacterium]|jgi:RNA polymerase sigma-70 factor (ECF subfamily)
MELCIGTKLLSSRQNDLAAELALVERCRNQDAEAFGKIVDAYQHRVFGFVRRMVSDQDEAADVSQEVFIRAYQGMVRFDGRSSLRTWLFRIAYNLCIDRSRKIDRTPMETRIEAVAEDEQPMEFPDARWDPETMLMTDELVSMVDAALESMSEKLRSVLLLHDKEDMAYDEIAQTLNLPIGTVKSRLFLARNHLQQALSEYVQGRGN